MALIQIKENPTSMKEIILLQTSNVRKQNLMFLMIKIIKFVKLIV